MFRNECVHLDILKIWFLTNAHANLASQLTASYDSRGGHDKDRKQDELARNVQSFVLSAGHSLLTVLCNFFIFSTPQRCRLQQF